MVTQRPAGGQQQAALIIVSMTLPKCLSVRTFVLDKRSLKTEPECVRQVLLLFLNDPGKVIE